METVHIIKADLFDPEQTIAREIMAAVVGDAEQTTLALRAKMGDGRDRRVAALSDQLSTQANQLIYASLAANSRTAQQQRTPLLAHSNASIDDSIIDGEAHTWVGDSGVPAPVVNVDSEDTSGNDSRFPFRLNRTRYQRRDIGGES